MDKYGECYSNKYISYQTATVCNPFYRDMHYTCTHNTLPTLRRTT